ncbi:MAG: hypothetical protein RIQ46_668, partial [Pseudomonadota bacterium]
GLQGKIALGYKRDHANFTRTNILGSGLTVEADGGFETVGLHATAGYGIKLGDSAFATPYAAFTLSSASRLAYREETQQAGGLDAMFSYGKFTAKQVSGALGLRLNGRLAPRVTYRVGAAVEHDFTYDLDSFVLRGDFGSSAYTSPIRPRDYRVSGSGGLGLDVTPNSALTLDGYVSQYNYGSRAEYTIMAAYKVGF